MKSKPEIATLISDFNTAVSYDAPRRSRIIRNSLATTGVEGSSYTPEEQAYLRREGMEASDYTFLSKYVKGITGTIIGNWYQPKFVAHSGAGISEDMIATVNAVYMADKDLHNYKSTAMQTIYNGVICFGAEEITIDRPLLSDPKTWGIRFKPLRPETIIFVQSDEAGRLSETAQAAYKYSYPTLLDLEKIYPDKKAEIKKMVNDLMPRDEVDRTSSVYDSVLDPYEDIRGKKYKVVEYYHMEHEKITQRVFIDTWEPLPEKTPGSPMADNLALHAWAAERGVVLTEDKIIEIEDVVPTLYVDVFIPELQIVLDSGKDERQIDRLPFFGWSYMENNGIPVGVVDLLWATAQDILKREKAKTKYIEKTPTAKPWVHPDIVGNDPGKLSRVINEWNDSSKPLVVDSEVTPGMVERLMGIERGVDIPQAVLHDESFKMSLMDSLSGLTPSMQGQTERSGESGIMFQKKMLESTAQQRLPMLTLAEHEKAKASAWLVLAQTVYGGTANYNREFSLPKDRGVLRINEFKGYDEEGNTVVEHDFSNLDRVDVSIGKAPESDYYRQATRAADLEALKSMRPSQTNSEIIAVLENNIILNMDFSDDEEKTKAEEAVARRAELERLQAIAQITKMETAITQGDVAGMMAEVDAALMPLTAEVKAKQTQASSKEADMKMQQMDQAAQQAANPQPQGPPGGGQPQKGPAGPPQGKPGAQQAPRKPQGNPGPPAQMMQPGQ